MYGVVEHFVRGGGYAVADAELFHERFGGFEFGCRFAWAEAGNAQDLQLIGKTCGCCGLRADDDEINLLTRRERCDLSRLLDLQRKRAPECGEARIAGRRHDFGDQRALLQLPAQSVLTPARPNDQNLHGLGLRLGAAMVKPNAGGFA